VACVAIIVVGTRFLLTPRRATLDFGVPADSLRALTAIKGVRDITSGAVLLGVWAAGGPEPLGWALIVSAITPTADTTSSCARTAGSWSPHWASTAPLRRSWSQRVSHWRWDEP
jgi:hypothetical protein